MNSSARVSVTKDAPFIIKDYGHLNIFLRLTYGRYVLKREYYAYKKLSGLEGITECLGFKGPGALAFQHIPGKTLSGFKRGEIQPVVFERIESLLAKIHSRGVAHGDIHRSNIMIAENGRVYIIDFASAVTTGNPENPNFLYTIFKLLDINALNRIKARYLMKHCPKPAGFIGRCYRIVRRSKSKTKKIKRLLSWTS